MCNWGTTVTMELEIPADLSRTGKAYRRKVKIDACIAPIVKALNDAGIKTRQSCCGHGKGPGSIDLADGRELVVMARGDGEASRLGWAILTTLGDEVAECVHGVLCPSDSDDHVDLCVNVYKYLYKRESAKG